jgi:hypothetical protein
MTNMTPHVEYVSVLRLSRLYERSVLLLTETARYTFEALRLQIQDGSNMTGTDLCVNKSQFVPVIFEPPCTSYINIMMNREKNNLL